MSQASTLRLKLYLQTDAIKSFHAQLETPSPEKVKVTQGGKRSATLRAKLGVANVLAWLGLSGEIDSTLSQDTSRSTEAEFSTSVEAKLQTIIEHASKTESLHELDGLEQQRPLPPLGSIVTFDAASRFLSMDSEESGERFLQLQGRVADITFDAVASKKYFCISESATYRFVRQGEKRLVPVSGIALVLESNAKTRHLGLSLLALTNCLNPIPVLPSFQPAVLDAFVLGQSGAAEALGNALKQLPEGAEQLKVLIVRALSASPHWEAKKSLLQFIKSESSYFLCCEAMNGLTCPEDPRVSEELHQMLREDTVERKEFIVSALHRNGQVLSEEMIRKLLRDTKPWVRASVFRYLHRLHDGADLLRQLVEDDKDTCHEALLELSQFPETHIHSFLWQIARSGSKGSLQLCAGVALVQQGVTEAVSLCVELIDRSRSGWQCNYAVEVLAKLKCPQLLPVLMDIVGDREAHDKLRVKAALALGEYRDEESMKMLKQIVNRGFPDNESEAFLHSAAMIALEGNGFPAWNSVGGADWPLQYCNEKEDGT